MRREESAGRADPSVPNNKPYDKVAKRDGGRDCGQPGAVQNKITELTQDFRSDAKRKIAGVASYVKIFR